ncbi:hypothetical protein DOY81_006260, partial [Sarcophaga bullata]
INLSEKKMKSREQVFVFYIMLAFTILAMSHIMASDELPLELAIKAQLAKEQCQHDKTNKIDNGQPVKEILKRKRRYLEFPEGTSFQLVYDLIVGVVDYTNYLILGVTVALAWELPSKPPSEILDDLTERLKDGTLGTSRNDTVENIKYIDNKKSQLNQGKNYNQRYQYSIQPMFRPPMHYRYYNQYPLTDSYYRAQTPLRSKTYITNGRDNWSKKQPFNQLTMPKQYNPFTKWIHKPVQYSSAGIKYPWWSLPQRLQSSFMKKQQKPSIRRFDQNILRAKATPYRRYKNFQGTSRAAHRIYPVFGKRSISNDRKHNETETSKRSIRFRRNGISTAVPTKLNRIHIEHHRRTRHDLYQRIEIYLNGRGAHGHHCVLKALCETGQKSHEYKPGSFVGELMRAIFTMPEPLDAITGHREKRYDMAHAMQDNCANRYHLCKDSLWSSHFVL